VPSQGGTATGARAAAGSAALDVEDLYAEAAAAAAAEEEEEEEEEVEEGEESERKFEFGSRLVISRTRYT